MKRASKPKRTVPITQFLARRTAPRAPPRQESPAIPVVQPRNWLVDSSSSSSSVSPTTPRTASRKKPVVSPPSAPKKRNQGRRSPPAELAVSNHEDEGEIMHALAHNNGARQDSLLLGLPVGFLEFVVLNGPRLRTMHGCAYIDCIAHFRTNVVMTVASSCRSGHFAVWSAELMHMWRMLPVSTRANFESCETGGSCTPWLGDVIEM